VYGSERQITPGTCTTREKFECVSAQEIQGEMPTMRAFTQRTQMLSGMVIAISVPARSMRRT
jgi:hypothetical protein